jgi:hypothetical protein
MFSVLAFIRQIVPYDPTIDTPLAHRNLVLIYCAIWGFQLVYAAYAVLKWRAVRKDIQIPIRSTSSSETSSLRRS